jgi:hypothetical protein
MNKPNKNDFDDHEIYKYIMLLEECIDELEDENKKLRNNLIKADNILDEMTIDWLRDDSNWEIIKQMALKQN